MSTHHMNTHHGWLKEEGRFFPALRGTSLQQGVGVERRGRVGMWIKQHGGKILGPLASVCFLLISHLVVLHVKLTTMLRSLLSAMTLGRAVFSVTPRKLFGGKLQKQHIWFLNFQLRCDVCLSCVEYVMDSTKNSQTSVNLCHVFAEAEPNQKAKHDRG